MQKVLEMSSANTMKHVDVQNRLLPSWARRHTIRTHEQCGKIPDLPAGKKSLAAASICQRVGVCLCGEAMKPRRNFRAALASQLGMLLKKGSPSRQAYDRGQVVLRLRVQDVNRFSLGMAT